MEGDGKSNLLVEGYHLGYVWIHDFGSQLVGRNKDLKKDCHWWKDVSLLGSKLYNPLDWFSSSFSVQYERLLLVSEQRFQLVRGVDYLVESVWDFRWSRSLLVWEEGLIGRMNGVVKQGQTSLEPIAT